MINQDEDGSFYLENHREKTVAELINWHRSTRTALATATPAKLRRSIERPQWLLNHDSIRLSKKLGEGETDFMLYLDVDLFRCLW